MKLKCITIFFSDPSMLRRSNRKRSVPAERGDAIAVSAKRAIRNPHSTVGSSTSTAISGSTEINYSRGGMPASFVLSISSHSYTQRTCTYNRNRELRKPAKAFSWDATCSSCSWDTINCWCIECS
jgi:hypothetical protein